MKFRKRHLFGTMTSALFGLLLWLGRKLPTSYVSATAAALLAGLAAGAMSLGALFAAFDFFALSTPNPQLILLLFVSFLLLSIHGAMASAEASTAAYMVGKGAAEGSRWRETLAMVGAITGHLLWGICTFLYLSPARLALGDDFWRLFLYMIAPSALLAAPLAALGAYFAPTRR